MAKSEKFRNTAFPFLEDPESLFLLGGPSVGVPALGPDDYLKELQFGLSRDDFPQYGSLF